MKRTKCIQEQNIFSKKQNKTNTTKTKTENMKMTSILKHTMISIFSYDIASCIIKIIH